MTTKDKERAPGHLFLSYPGIDIGAPPQFDVSGSPVQPFACHPKAKRSNDLREPTQFYQGLFR